MGASLFNFHPLDVRRVFWDQGGGVGGVGGGCAEDLELKAEVRVRVPVFRASNPLGSPGYVEA